MLAARPHINLSAGRRVLRTPGIQDARTAHQPQNQAKQAKPRVAEVKRGDTLWAMAHRFYGKGIRYGEIAGANKEQIKDPNLIYPNQQLAIPEEKAP